MTCSTNLSPNVATVCTVSSTSESPRHEELQATQQHVLLESSGLCQCVRPMKSLITVHSVDTRIWMHTAPQHSSKSSAVSACGLFGELFTVFGAVVLAPRQMDVRSQRRLLHQSRCSADVAPSCRRRAAECQRRAADATRSQTYWDGSGRLTQSAVAPWSGYHTRAYTAADPSHAFPSCHTSLAHAVFSASGPPPADSQLVVRGALRLRCGLRAAELRTRRATCSCLCGHRRFSDATDFMEQTAVLSFCTVFFFVHRLFLPCVLKMIYFSVYVVWEERVFVSPFFGCSIPRKHLRLRGTVTEEQGAAHGSNHQVRELQGKCVL